MDDLIDRRSLKKVIAGQAMTDWCKVLANAIIDDAPTVDAVEVVRCQDCKWSRELDKSSRIERCYPNSAIWCERHAVGVLPGEFCSGGKRKEAEFRG